MKFGNEDHYESGIYLVKNTKEDKIYIGKSFVVDSINKTYLKASSKLVDSMNINDDYRELLEDIRDTPIDQFEIKVLGYFKNDSLDQAVKFFKIIYKDYKFYGGDANLPNVYGSNFVSFNDDKNLYVYEYCDDHVSCTLEVTSLDLLKDRVKHLGLPW